MQTHSGRRGPHIIAPECSIDCLRYVLSRVSLNTLARAYDAPFNPPTTVEDVVDLYLQGRLCEICGLGPHRIREIETALISAGLITADGQIHRRRKPGALLEAIAQGLKSCGLEIREFRHGDELVEILIANPEDASKGEARVGYDGKVTWESSGDIETCGGMEGIRDTITGLLIGDVTNS